MARLLLTYFEPFDNISTNSTELTAERIQSPHWEICKLRLPVSFRKAWPLTLQQIISWKPEFVLALGQADGRDVVTVEKIALNRVHARIPDNDRDQPLDQPIAKDINESSLLNPLDILYLCQKVKPAVDISFFAGTYVCNYLYFQLLHQQKKIQYQTLFMHLPLALEQNVTNQKALPLQQLIDTTHSLLEEIKTWINP